MKLKKKWLISIGGAVVVLCVASLLLFTGGGNAESITYALESNEDGITMYGRAVQNGDEYHLMLRTGRDFVRGSYVHNDDESSMENWGDVPLCYDGLYAIQSDEDEAPYGRDQWTPLGNDLYEYSNTYRGRDGYYYSDDYYCQFDRENLTYERWSPIDYIDWSAAYVVAAEREIICTVWRYPDATAASEEVWLKDDVAIVWAGDEWTVKRQQGEGKTIITLENEWGESFMLEERDNGYYHIERGVMLEHIYDDCYATLGLPEGENVGIRISGENSAFVLSEAGREEDVDRDMQLKYKPGKLLDVSIAGVTFKCQVEGDKLYVYPTTVSTTYCLTRADD